MKQLLLLPFFPFLSLGIGWASRGDEGNNPVTSGIAHSSRTALTDSTTGACRDSLLRLPALHRPAHQGILIPTKTVA